MLVALTIGVMETGFRVYYFGVDALIRAARYSPADAWDRGMLDRNVSPSLGWRLQPDLDLIYKGARFTTNSHGFRSPEVTVTKPEGVLRIAIMGRSITMGSGVSDQEVYTARLQAMLNEHEPGRYQVLNFAVGGYNQLQMSEVFESRIKRFEPDLVIIPEATKTFRMHLPLEPVPLPILKWSDLKRYLRHLFFYRALRKAFGNWMRNNVSHDWGERARRSSNNPVPRIRSVDVVSQFIEQRADDGIPVVVVLLLRTHWDPAQTHQTERVRQIRKWVNRQPNASFINTDRPLRSQMEPADYIFYGDEHPNAKIHDLYAQIIYENLEPILILHGLR